MRTRTAVLSAAALAAVSVCSDARAGENEPGNDSFPGQTVAGDETGVSLMGDLIDYGCLDEGEPFNECAPDTIIGAFDIGGLLLESDDDDSPLGNGLASGVFGVPLSKSGGVVSLIVTGFPDYDFDGDADFGPPGPHGQVGFFETFVDYFDAGGSPLGQVSMGVSEFTGGPDLFAFMPTPPAGAATYDAYIDNDRFRLLFVMNPLYGFISMVRWALMDQPVDAGAVLCTAAWTVVVTIGGFIWFRAAEHEYDRV